MRKKDEIIKTLRLVGFSATEVDGVIRITRPLRQEPDVYDIRRPIDRKALEMLCNQADDRWHRSNYNSVDAAAQTLLFQAAEDILCCGYNISMEISWFNDVVYVRDPVTRETLFIEQLDDLRRAAYLAEDCLAQEDAAHVGEVAQKYGTFIQMCPRDVPSHMVGPEEW